MINKLARLGYSITYDEINPFRQSSVQVGEQGLPESFPERFTQWSGDNVDHSIATLDCEETFHGMGIITMIVPCSLSRLQPGHYSEQSVKRLPRQKVCSITRNKEIPIHDFSMPDTVFIHCQIYCLNHLPEFLFLCHQWSLTYCDIFDMYKVMRDEREIAGTGEFVICLCNSCKISRKKYT